MPQRPTPLSPRPLPSGPRGERRRSSARLAALLVCGLLASAASCSHGATLATDDSPVAGGGTGGAPGPGAGAGGAGRPGAGGGSGASPSQGGAHPGGLVGGAAGAPDAGMIDAAPDVVLLPDVVIPDAMADSCAPPPPPATITQHCRPPTDNECDGLPYMGVELHKPEGEEGNGFDDDCDGKVDEGCSCAKEGNGASKDCYLLPSSQTTGATGSPPWAPVGWCAKNTKGKEVCSVVGGGEFSKTVWNGTCQGAQPPYTDDVCAAGDYNCDGVDANPAAGCQCTVDPVQCPNPIFTRPFPDPMNVGIFAATSDDALAGNLSIPGIDGLSWITDPAIAAAVTNWRWTVVGSPCDDVLPNTTFGVFATNDASNWSSHLGQARTKLPQVPDKDQPDPAQPAADKRGWVLSAGNTPHRIFPAFSLSGDYYVTAKFSYPDPQNPGHLVDRQCTQVVKVRAPGLRVELCWPEVGLDTGHDEDLHVARLQGNNGPGVTAHGWMNTAGSDPNGDDCYYGSACSSLGVGTPQWFPNETVTEPKGTGVCHGWGSKRGSDRPCSSPRLDNDDISCDPTISDPNDDTFCRPENINLDDQVLKTGDRYAVGVNCFNCSIPSTGPQAPSHPHVNVFCNGELKIATGLDPQKIGKGVTQYPQLWVSGHDSYSSLWNVGVVTWNADDPANPCSFDAPTAPKWHEDYWHRTSDGSQFVCVENGPLDSNGDVFNPQSAAPGINNWPFRADGQYPTDANDLCPTRDMSPAGSGGSSGSSGAGGSTGGKGGAAGGGGKGGASGSPGSAGSPAPGGASGGGSAGAGGAASAGSAGSH